jgi:hypothetical protein
VEAGPVRELEPGVAGSYRVATEWAPDPALGRSDRTASLVEFLVSPP